MRITIERLSKADGYNKETTRVKKVIETRDIASYEESTLYEGGTDVFMYTGEFMTLPQSFLEFDELVTKAIKYDEEEEKRADLGI